MAAKATLLSRYRKALVALGTSALAGIAVGFGADSKWTLIALAVAAPLGVVLAPKNAP